MFTRRGFVTLIGGAAVVAALPACGDNLHPPSGRFLDPHQWRTIDVATGLILPGTELDPGARETMAVRYIDALLGAFEVAPPALFAGGPASGRYPYPDARGLATSHFPDNAFATYLPISRVTELAWRMRLYGTAETTGGAFNDAVLGPRRGWRDLYADGVRALDDAAAKRLAGASFVQLDAADQQAVLAFVAAGSPAFFQLLVEHTVEGVFAAPEYGGNELLQGWDRIAAFDGDSVPLGHATLDELEQRYRDRADQPTSQPSPGATTETFDAATLELLTRLAVDSGGKRYF